MAIKFLAFLGKNRYTAGRYELNGYLSIHTPFSQVAVLDVLQSQNIAPDDVYIFLTSEARRQNWADSGSGAPASGVWLKDQLAELQHRLGFSVHDIAIPDEQDQGAIWSIFARVIDCLDTYDEVIFDVTHRFGTNPC
ncbi:MAG TPA: hypothetical protein GX517_07045 [Alicyclobacillus sp.]|nr:hypothetical protein [Alicyclobacillus sp.]